MEGTVGPLPWPAFRQDPAARRGVASASPTCPGVAAQRFFTVPPCRLVDTRGAVGPLGGPALAAMTTRNFPVTGTCSIPSTARSVALNVTVTGNTSYGDVRVFPAGASGITASTINWRTGQTRANNAIVGLGANGSVTVWCVMFSGFTHVVLDVVGYFE
jgi:hypothetical protein